jgi:hypothetical protein
MLCPHTPPHRDQKPKTLLFFFAPSVCRCFALFGCAAFRHLPVRRRRGGGLLVINGINRLEIN